jgi:hypothetical protein
LKRSARAVLSGLAAVACVGFASSISAQPAEFEPVEVSASPVANFKVGSSEMRFGALEFVGGFELTSPAPEFGQLSALRFLTPGSEFIGVADHGYWFRGRIERDEAGLPTGFSGFAMQPMVDASGIAIADKANKDAEGLDVMDGIATVSFEREPRVSEYRIDGPSIGAPIRDLDYVVPRHELRYNQGFETVTRAHPYGIHEGARVVIAERSIDADGNIFAAILEGVEKGIFKIKRSDGFDVTDGVFLDDGNLLLLERRFSTITGAAMRLRLIYGESVRKDGLADGPVLMEADLAYRIDNMEALDVWKRSDGETIISVMSDNNQSFLQRTFYLEFRVAETVF